MRDNIWLKKRLNFFLQNYFSDINLKNKLLIFFGRRARARLGSIQFNPKTRQTVIRITAFFRDKKIPQYVVDATIIHELIHYAHGFSSPLPQAFRYPHQGGIIKTEITKRGLAAYHLKSKIWLKKKWPNYVKSKTKFKRIRKRRRRVSLVNFLISEFLNF